jgi:hypothetical protein
MGLAFSGRNSKLPTGQTIPYWELGMHILKCFFMGNLLTRGLMIGGNIYISCNDKKCLSQGKMAFRKLFTIDDSRLEK